MSIREIEHQDLKVRNLKEKEKLKEHKRCPPAKRKVYKRIKISDIFASGTTIIRSINSYTEQTQQKRNINS